MQRRIESSPGGILSEAIEWLRPVNFNRKQRVMEKGKMNLEELLTPEQLCDRLQVKRSWVYRQVREKSIPHLHLGKYLRFYKPEVEKWLLERRQLA